MAGLYTLSVRGGGGRGMGDVIDFKDSPTFNTKSLVTMCENLGGHRGKPANESRGCVITSYVR